MPVELIRTIVYGLREKGEGDHFLTIAIEELIRSQASWIFFA